MGALVARQAQTLVGEALADTRVLLVNGARQAGKSTLTRLATADRPGTAVRLLDDPVILRAAREDPVGFVDHDGLMVIDEIQLAPELLRPIKLKVDLDPRPGQFILAGSARILALRTLPDALPGRMEIIELWQFSQGEIGGEPDRFVGLPDKECPGLVLEPDPPGRRHAEAGLRRHRGGLPPHRTGPVAAQRAGRGGRADCRKPGPHGARPPAHVVRRAGKLADLLGDRFIAGYVLYAGQQTLPFGEKIRALPLDALWRLSPTP